MPLTVRRPSRRLAVNVSGQPQTLSAPVLSEFTTLQVDRESRKADTMRSAP